MVNKIEGFEIEIGRDEDTKDFCVIMHDGGKAPDRQLLDALKEVVTYLEKELVRDEYGGSTGTC